MCKGKSILTVLSNKYCDNAVFRFKLLFFIALLEFYMSLLRVLFFLSFLIRLHAQDLTIAVAGTGLTGLWTVYSLCQELENYNIDSVKLVVIGKWNWKEALENSLSEETTVFTHEASGFGPIGIQPHSGLLWNTDNEVVDLVKKGIGKPEASFYTAPNLEEEGRVFLELYAGWHGRHLDQYNDPASSYNRQRSLININRYARRLWGQFYAEQNISNDNNPFDIHLDGAWRVYDDPVHFNNALNSLKILQQYDYPAVAIADSYELANQIPFYRDAILRDQKKGIYFSDDGLVSSNKIRKYIWSYLQKCNILIEFYLDSEVDDLLTDENGNCTGVVLKNGEEVEADLTFLAMGLANKNILKQHDIDLPLWNVWGAAIKAPLNDLDIAPPTGGVSFHSNRCITAAPDGKTMIIAGTSMVVSENETPHPTLYRPKLLRNLDILFGDRVDQTQVVFNVAPRTGIADDLPVIGFDVPNISNLVVLNPTSHLGNTQSIALGKLAALYAIDFLGYIVIYPKGLDLFDYRLDRFEDDIQKVIQDREEGNILLF
jgi:glycine/D-amino acid oxidase-like deaminating enzyme